MPSMGKNRQKTVDLTSTTGCIHAMVKAVASRVLVTPGSTIRGEGGGNTFFCVHSLTILFEGQSSPCILFLFCNAYSTHIIVTGECTLKLSHKNKIAYLALLV